MFPERGYAGVLLGEQLVQAMDERTRRLLRRRRRAHRAQLVPLTLVIADLLGLGLAYYLTTLLMSGDGAFGSPTELVVFVLTLPCWVIAAKLHGLYERDQERADHSTTDDVVGIFHIVVIGVWLLLLASRLAGRTAPGIYALTVFAALAVCAVAVARTVARDACKHSGAYQQNTLIVGAGEIGQLIGRKLVKHPEYGLNVVGFVDRDPRQRRADLPEHFTILGPPEQIADIIRLLDVERVVIAFAQEPVAEMLTLVRQLRGLPSRSMSCRGFRIDRPPRGPLLGGGHPSAGPPAHAGGPGARTVKRGIDVIGAGIVLVALAPLFGYIALRIRLDSAGPILFRQVRLKGNMEEFTFFKFRTMAVETDETAHRDYIAATMSPQAQANGNGLYKLDRSASVTSFGRWLRRTSFDELPQLINVLRGDMSLVGPRPCIPYELEHYQRHHFERFSVPQGLTGLWQVTARANATYGESLDMDVAYVRGWSLGLDLRLLLRTPLQVFHQRTSTT